MSNLTVCIPAYRSEAFIHDTLRSLLTQTHSDFVVEIAVEPPAEEILSACGPLLRDERVRVFHNPQVLGLAENTRRQLRRIETPYFLRVPHDDLLAPDYIDILLTELMRRPEAAVAYSDLVCFDAASWHWGFVLPDAPLFDQLMSFFLGGADALPKAGVMRSKVLDHYDYPTDRYGGFAVECEFVLHLLITGRAIHVPRPLYQKRIRSDGMNASAQRIRGHSREFIREALEDHRMRMLALLRKTGFPKAMQNQVELAAEAAMLRRYMTLNLGAFLPAQIARAEQVLIFTEAASDSYGKGIRAMALSAMSRHAAIAGHKDFALGLAIAALDSDPSLWEGLAHLSKLHLEANRSVEALGAARRAWAASPNARGLRELIAECESEIEQDRHREIMRNGQSAMLAERFDAASYLIDFPDVAAAGVDPWQHYCDFGWQEGRAIRLLPVIR